MGKGFKKIGKVHKKICIPKKRCMEQGCDKLAEYFEYENNKIKKKHFVKNTYDESKSI